MTVAATAAPGETDFPSVVVDTSAAVAVLLGQPGSDELIAILESAPARLMSAASYVELGVIIEARLGFAAADVAPRFVRDAEIELVAVDPDLAERALGGWRRYGKGRHPAGLDYGDCFAYALAERLGAVVLCVDDGFAATDVDVIKPSRS